MLARRGVSADSPVSVHPVRVRRGPIINTCYVLVDEAGGADNALIIDPAWEEDTIELALRNLNVRLTGIILTHSHLDHVDLAPALANRHHCPVYMSRDEIAASGFNCRGLEACEDGQLIGPGRVMVKAVATPGHTIGSMCFLTDDALFSGDTLFMEGCGLPTEPGGDVDSLYESLLRLKRIVPRHCRVMPGHKYTLPLGLTMAEVTDRNVYLAMPTAEHFRGFRQRAGQTGLFDFR